MRRLVIATLAVFVSLALPAAANVISFETAPAGPGFTGPVTENGFTYTTSYGSFVIAPNGNPGHDLEAAMVDSGGGVLSIRRAGGGTFRFDSIDFAAFDRSGTGTQDLILGGLIEDFILFDVFTASNAAGIPYANWTTEFADRLNGLWLDELIIILGGGSDPSAFASAIDNVVLTPGADVPEPASLALFAGGILFAARRRRRI